MSSTRDALPPQTAPLNERLAVAMRLAGYKSARQLARDLGTDSSLVGKWLHGDVLEIKSLRHLEELPRLLNTPGGYFRTPSRRDLLEALQAEVTQLRKEFDDFLQAATGRLADLEASRGRPRQRSTRRSSGGSS